MLRPVSGAPSTKTSPEEGASSPAARLSSVDLPHRVGPTMATNSWAPTARSVAATAGYHAAQADRLPPREVNVAIAGHGRGTGRPIVQRGSP